MKKRSKVRRQRSRSSARQPLGIFSRAQRKRKTYTFEQLESRMVFSAAPLETGSLSSSTAGGAEAIWQRELQWVALQAANAVNATNATDPYAALRALPTDPLFADQWHLLNLGPPQEVGNPDFGHLFGVAGEDINVVPAWNLGYTGQGVMVAVIDTGVQLFHPDLTDNIHPTLRFNAINGSTNVNPSLIDPGAGHGTSVAGLIASPWNNNEGGTGVAPDATIVPILLLGQSDIFDPNSSAIGNAFLYAMQNGVDVTNNSWGPPDNRSTINLTEFQATVLRETVLFGRNGLGMINIWASGNGGGPSFSPGFEGFGNYDSASYDAFVNSRYTIGITGVDHDGQYRNADGTFTSYPEIGPSVLVAAPTASNVAQNVASDSGQGSGIWTTDLVGDFGFNGAPVGGFDPDRDLLEDPNYTSRFNGTSAAAPIAAGVVALMLDANPGLTYRDVQEILVRSARQNAQFEFPSSGALFGAQSTWQVNQIEPFRNPDPYDPMDPRWQGSGPAIFNPLADPTIDGSFGGSFYAPNTNDGGRQGISHYEPQPGIFTNGAGFTVSQGYGVFAEAIGYAHGVIDAELAVRLATQWHNLDQNLNPLTEKTFTTFVVQPGDTLLAAERMNLDFGGMLVPGGIGSPPGAGYIEYWNEYFADDPFNDYDGKTDVDRGFSYLDFAVPPSEAINVEWVEVKFDISGPAEDLDYIRLMLTSPNGTQSELNHYYADPDHLPFSVQSSSAPAGAIDPVGDLNNTGGNFIWTFSTNRHWGESTNSTPILHPVTGEPLLDENGNPIFRNWELHIENWSNSAFVLQGIEVVFHGKPIEGGALDPNYASEGIGNAQRVQGFVGIDTNSDGDFNFSRYVQTVSGSHSDVDTIRTNDVRRQLDFNDNNSNGIFDAGDTINQEPFAENIIVEAYRVYDDVAETKPIAKFLTGADGNYFFDFNVQADQAHATAIGATTFEYEIRIKDPQDRVKLDDVTTPASPMAPPGLDYMPHYLQTWRINSDWFFAPDRDNTLLLGNQPGEILFDPTTNTPVPFTNNGSLDRIPMAVMNLNFLLKQDAPANQFVVNGTVYADLNGNGKFDGDDAPAGGVFVYWDANFNKSQDPGELTAVTDANGQYSMIIDLTTLPEPPTGNANYQIGVIPPNVDWIPTDPGGDAVELVFAGPGSSPQVVNFFLDPPSDPDGGNAELGTILGIVYNDVDKDGTRDVGEQGISGIRVFIDATEDGVWNVDPNTGQLEISVLTGSNGAYSFSDVAAGLIRIDVHIPDEGTPNAAYTLTGPAAGFREVALGAGGTISGISFGLENRANRDWDDLPDSYNTTSTSSPVGPSHRFLPGFRLGSNIDGEVNGIPTGDALGDDMVGGLDDGVRVISNGGILRSGVNLLEVTVFGFGGVLTGWIDWDNSGAFEADEKIAWSSAAGTPLGLEADLVQGTYTLRVTANADIVDGALAARFRWGEPGLSSTGAANIGEVEGYYFTAFSGAVSGVAGDYNNNGTVDAADYVLWRKYRGTNTALLNDTTPNTNPRVTQADYDLWTSRFGLTSGAGAGAGAGETSQPATEVPLTSAPVATLPAVSVSAPVEAAPASTPAVAEPTTVDSPLFVSFAGPASSSLSFEAGGLVQSDAGGGATASGADLLLLDQALAELDSGNDDEPLYDRFGHDEENVGDLELAAVFEDDTNWWSM